MSQYGEFEAVIGLEVHVQLATDTKLFCSCSARPSQGKTVGEEAPNCNTCPVCRGLPGTLPRLNRRAIECVIRAGAATQCQIRGESIFARKNYFYPDLPKGYQISQFEQPICENGKIEIDTAGGTPRFIRITRIHLEEDAGKSTHRGDTSEVNLNRAGVPLAEVVSEPDLRTPSEAGAYLRELYRIVTYLGLCDGNLEEGNFRCDANVSLRLAGESKLGRRVEIKNVNSFKFVERALEFEIQRQIQILRSGEKVLQETRQFDSEKGVTVSMRSKEEAQDYRYFPDPDLYPILLDSELQKMGDLKAFSVELPRARRDRYVRDLGLSLADADLLTQDRSTSELFDAALKKPEQAREIKNLIASEVLRLTNLHRKQWRDTGLTAEHFSEIVDRLSKGVLSNAGAKQVVEALWSEGGEVGRTIERLGLLQINDAAAIESSVEHVLSLHPEQVAEFRAGKEKVIAFLIGQAMKHSGGKANPVLVKELVLKKLKGS